VHTRQIERVLDEGRSLHGDRVVVFVAPGHGRFAVIAGRKVGGAVQRNRARRVLRAAWPAVADELGDRDTVLIARAAILSARTPDLEQELRSLLGGVHA